MEKNESEYIFLHGIILFTDGGKLFWRENSEEKMTHGGLISELLNKCLPLRVGREEIDTR